MNIAATKATVFDPKECDPTKRKNTVEANISTLESSKTDNTKKYSSWHCYFVGKAYKKAKNLKDKDFIELQEAKIDNNYDKKNEKLWVNVTVFDFKQLSNEN